MERFLAIYRLATRVDIVRNRNNVAENLGFLCRLVHGTSRSHRLKELKARLGEFFDYDGPPSANVSTACAGRNGKQLGRMRLERKNVP